MKKTKSKFLVPQCLSALAPSKKSAFTLAEVLITLAIIGVVATMTIPTLIQNYQERSWSTAADLFQKRLDIALKAMITQNSMNGYKSTKDFVEKGLSKNLKIIKTCEYNKLSDCFVSTFTYGTEELSVNDIQNSGNFDKEEWGSTSYGVVFADGTTAIMAYNPNCEYQDQYSNMVNATACISITYDVNGLKSPNTLNKDLYSINGTLSKYACISPGLKSTKGICVTKLVSVNYFSMEDCETQKEKLGLQYCWDGYNGGVSGNEGHWGDAYAGVVEACGGISKLASLEQLADIARYIYEDDSIQTTKSAYNLTVNETRWKEILGPNIPTSGAYYIVSNKEANKSAYERNFGDDSSQYTSNTRGWARRGICVR